MINHSNTSDIVIYLERIKILISAGKYDFVPRRKNMQSLITHNITLLDVKNEIMDLVVGNYYRGHNQDLNITRPEEIWEFKKSIGSIKIYVKVKIVQMNG